MDLEVNIIHPNIDETFCLIHPHSNLFCVSERFQIIDYFTKNLICVKYLAFKETMQLNDITDMHTFLAKNCDKDLFYKILRKQFQKRDENGDLYSFVNKEILVDFLVFTNYENLRSYKENIKYRVHADPLPLKTSREGKKPILGKDYCHKSKWNFVKNRPYTESELIELFGESDNFSKIMYQHE